MSESAPNDHVFAAHFEDWTAPSLTSRLAVRLRAHGLVTLSDLEERPDVLAVARRVMMISAHRDSDADGITAVRDLGPSRWTAGSLGLGTGALLPHTDSAQQLPAPPRLLLLACAAPAPVGGTSLLVDGQAVYSTLAAECPDAVEAFRAKRAALFGTGNGRFCPVFDHNDTGRAALALRQDALARFSPAAEAFLPALREAIRRHLVSLDLRVGQAYLLDNHRWLHAREDYQGPRLMLRALGEAVPGLGLQHGFATDQLLRSSRPMLPSGPLAHT